jgi:hypothetical protein
MPQPQNDSRRPLPEGWDRPQVPDDWDRRAGQWRDVTAEESADELGEG